MIFFTTESGLYSIQRKRFNPRNRKFRKCIQNEKKNTKSILLSTFAELLPDAIQSDCSKCSDVQKRNSRKVITFLRTRRPQDWKKLTDKYDPQGLFKKRIDAGLV